MSNIDILFAMNNLEALGIQKVICTMLASWDTQKNGVAHLSVHNKQGKFVSHLNVGKDTEIYTLDDWSILTHVKGIRFLGWVISYCKLIYKVKPKKVIAVNQGEALALCIVKRFIKDFRLVVCEHCHVTASINDYAGWFGWYYRHFFQHEYTKYADMIHTVSYESRDDLIENWGFAPEKVAVIYNPAMVDIKKIVKKESDFSKAINITMASRITKQKRIDIMLNGLSAVRDRVCKEVFNKIHVKIVGDGDLLEEMKSLCTKLNLDDIVEWKGFVIDPWIEVAQSDLFVTTSEWEGLSVSLIEAMTVGTPCFASDCPSGNKELLLNGEAGKLFKFNDIDDFCDKFIDILKNPYQLQKYREVADKNLYRFDIYNLMDQYVKI